MRSEWTAKALVLSACLVGHVIAFAWLHGYAPAPAPAPASPQVTQVTLIAATREPPPPPMPRRPSSTFTARRFSVLPSHHPRSTSASAATPASVPAPMPTPYRRRRPNEWEPLDGLVGPAPPRFARPDPMQPLAPRLPGSSQPIVEGFHVRRERSVADVVRIAGGLLFGGNYDPCPDIQGKLHDATVLRPDKYRDSERNALVERERRCRYR